MSEATHDPAHQPRHGHHDQPGDHQRHAPGGAVRKNTTTAINTMTTLVRTVHQTFTDINAAITAIDAHAPNALIISEEISYDTAAGRRKRMTKKEWEPKTSDCFLVTGGQLKRLRDEPDYDKRREMLYPMAHQRYITEIGKENEKFASDKQQSTPASKAATDDKVCR